MLYNTLKFHLSHTVWIQNFYCACRRYYTYFAEMCCRFSYASRRNSMQWAVDSGLLSLCRNLKGRPTIWYVGSQCIEGDKPGWLPIDKIQFLRQIETRVFPRHVLLRRPPFISSAVCLCKALSGHPWGKRFQSFHTSGFLERRKIVFIVLLSTCFL